MRTKVAIIGAGPAGLLLSQILHVNGIDCIILEQRSRSYVESRIRAGVLEQITVDLLDKVGVNARMHREGLPHDGFNVGSDGDVFRIDLTALTRGSKVMVYGQTEVTRDLIAAAIERGTPLIFEAKDVTPHDVVTDLPYVTYVKDGESYRVDCDFIAGCDGFHGVCRGIIPEISRKTYERIYPFGWLGILADVPPCMPELIYSNHERGFALASMRSPTRSRYYIQSPVDEDLNEWPDDRVWDELAIRLGDEAASTMTRGPSIEKSIAPLRSFVSEPMRYGRLFLAGDAAHIVPPTGAKGLNLATADVYFLSNGLIAYYRDGSEAGLDTYSARALARVWKAERFSWWFTSITHRFPDMDSFGRKMQIAELEYLRGSRAAQTVMAENYVGLPLE
jgi:p-hydroxybenzoate 3-monooxygenase